MIRYYTERFQRLWRELSIGSKQLGSNSEVECFRVRIRDRLLIERIDAVETP